MTTIAGYSAVQRAEAKSQRQGQFEGLIFAGIINAGLLVSAGATENVSGLVPLLLTLAPLLLACVVLVRRTTVRQVERNEPEDVRPRKTPSLSVSEFSSATDQRKLQLFHRLFGEAIDLRCLSQKEGTVRDEVDVELSIPVGFELPSDPDWFDREHLGAARAAFDGARIKYESFSLGPTRIEKVSLVGQQVSTQDGSDWATDLDAFDR